MSENEHDSERKDERDNERDDGDEVAWLLARERGQPGPMVSGATAARYARLQSMIEDLPATPGGARARAGWQRDVLAAIDAMEAGGEASSIPEPVGAPVGASVEAPVAVPVAAPVEAPAGELVQAPDSAVPKRSRTRRARWVAASSIVAVAATVAILLTVRRHGGDGDASISVPEFESAGAPHRGTDPSIGDTLKVHAVVEGPGELRVYGGHGVEQAHCAAAAPGTDCTVERSGNRTTLRLTMELRELGALTAVLFAAPLGSPSGRLDDDVEAAMRAGIAVTPRDLGEVR